MIKANYIATKVEFSPWWGQHRRIDRTNHSRMVQVVHSNTKDIGAPPVRVYDSDIPAIAHMNSLKNAIKEWWETNTHPYDQKATRLLLKSELSAFNACMEQGRADIAVGSKAVQQVRDVIIADARNRLNDAFKLSDYPLDLSALYGITVSFPNLQPSADLPSAVYEQQRQYLDSKIHEAAQLAQGVFTKQFAKLVSALAERIAPEADGKKKIFRDSAVGNLKEFFAQYEKLKLQDGDDLDQLISKTKALITGVSAQDLRDSDLLKEEIATALKTVEQGLTPLIVKAPRRMILKPSKPVENTNGQALPPTPIPA
jgi:hypothetical protein